MYRCALLLAFLAAFGCARTPPPPEPAGDESPALGRRFDPATCGGLVGVVRWDGPPPHAPATTATRTPGNYQDRSPLRPWPNPHAPVIDPASGGVRDAVVLLRGVDPERSKPWDLPPARVEIADAAIVVVQGDDRGPVGVVPRGAAVEMVSREERLHLLRARGAAFFSQPLTEPGVVRSRTLGSEGHVELSSGAGYFWMRAHLFVSEHPYVARTDAAGRFAFENVPAGPVEVVAWLPNWRERDHEVNPDTGLRTGVEFAAPLTQTGRATVEAGRTIPLPPAVFRE